MRTHEVARFVPEAAPSSSLLISKPLTQATNSHLLAQDPTVLDTLCLLGQKRHMADNIHWSDIARQQQQSLVSLPDRLDDLFDSSLELTGFRRLFDSLEDLLLQFGRGKGSSNWGNGIGRDVEFRLSSVLVIVARNTSLSIRVESLHTLTSPSAPSAATDFRFSFLSFLAFFNAFSPSTSIAMASALADPASGATGAISARPAASDFLFLSFFSFFGVLISDIVRDGMGWMWMSVIV